jgi:RimJ/RimL family protein N-acetyltransferase
MIPKLETERLILRGCKREDFEAYARFMSDPDVMRYLSGEPITRGEAWRNMAAIIGQWTLRGYGRWAVERKSDGAFIGIAGLNHPEGWPGLEAAWTLGKEYWGQGYASEAGQASLDYAFLTQDVAQMISLIDPRNTGSQKVAERIGETRGERREILFQGKTFTCDVWSISREDWQRRRARH